jgi:hypothetical protein
MLPTACAGRPVIVELREWSRIAEELGVERTRLANRLRFRPSSNSRATLAPEWLLVAQTAAHSSSRRFYLKAAVGAEFSFRLRAASIPGCVSLVSDAEERARDGL